MIEATIATQVHGRYLVRHADTAFILVGFHGYGESADIQMSRLVAIPGSDSWTLISIQALHRFYERKTNQVVASWMTRQDRDLAIADNIAYVSRVFEQAVTNWETVRAVVFAGFSQGVAMALRSAAATRGPQCHVLAVGGDVPPELSAQDLGHLTSALVCRGAEDAWYADEAHQRDAARLSEAGVPVKTATIAGGHVWSLEVDARAGEYLSSIQAGVVSTRAAS